MLALVCLAAAPALAVRGQDDADALHLVHYCDLRGECRQSHEVLRGTGPALPVRFATVDESLRALVDFDLAELPVTVLWRGKDAVGALVGQRRPELLQRELGRLELAIRRGEPPVRAAAARTQVPGDGGLVVVVEVRVRGGELTILRAQVMEGSAPRPYASRLDSHHVQLLAADGTPLMTRAWQPAPLMVSPPPLPGQTPTGPDEAIATRTAFVLPYHPDAVRVRIEQPFGLEAASAAIDLRPVRGRARRATEIHHTGDDDERLVVLVMGDAYKKAAKKRFPDDAQAIADFLLTVKPFRNKRKNINIYRSSTLNGLRCKYVVAADGKDSRLLVCNSAKVVKKAARDQLAYDELLVLVNSDKYGGSGGAAAGGGGPETYAVAYNRRGWEPGATQYGWGPEVAVHEFGHSFVGLMDEYPYGTAGVPWGPNCQVPPCTWKGGGLGCYDGCSYNGLARPTDRGCYMNVLQPDGGFHLCRIGLRQAKKVIRRY